MYDNYQTNVLSVDMNRYKIIMNYSDKEKKPSSIHLIIVRKVSVWRHHTEVALKIDTKLLCCSVLTNMTSHGWKFKSLRGWEQCNLYYTLYKSPKRSAKAMVAGLYKNSQLAIWNTIQKKKQEINQYKNISVLRDLRIATEIQGWKVSCRPTGL